VSRVFVWSIRRYWRQVAAWDVEINHAFTVGAGDASEPVGQIGRSFARRHVGPAAE
jgi:hypothetical protein